MDLKTNALYYGDNLGILRKYVPDESVDLVYLDPPFNSNRDYSVIFRDESGRHFDAQQLAFEDSWHWGPHAEATYAYLTNTAKHEGRIPSQVSALIAALRSALGENQVTAYLVEMTVRLVELQRVLKPTGSLYLHCDRTRSSGSAPRRTMTRSDTGESTTCCCSTRSPSTSDSMCFAPNWTSRTSRRSTPE